MVDKTEEINPISAFNTKPLPDVRLFLVVSELTIIVKSGRLQTTSFMLHVVKLHGMPLL